MIRNRNNKNSVENGGSTLPSRMTLDQLGAAMSQLDLSAVPPEKRRYAIRAHLLKVAAPSLQDTSLGQEISVSHFNHLVEASRLQRNLLFKD